MTGCSRRARARKTYTGWGAGRDGRGERGKTKKARKEEEATAGQRDRALFGKGQLFYWDYWLTHGWGRHCPQLGNYEQWRGAVDAEEEDYLE